MMHIMGNRHLNNKRVIKQFIITATYIQVFISILLLSVWIQNGIIAYLQDSVGVNSSNGNINKKLAHSLSNPSSLSVNIVLSFVIRETCLVR